jgi:arylsulfatase
MKNYYLLLTAPLLLGSCKEKKQFEKPNIIYILADDLGYGELGCYGQSKIETPNIDKLAKRGVKFTQHYSGSAVSAPSRCVLLTGKQPGNSFIRGNHEWGERGNVKSYEAMIKDSTLEGQFPLPDETLTIAEHLQSAGYKTGMVGKWGLGAPHTNSTPIKMGFDYFLGYNCQRLAHTYYPTHLYLNDKRMYLDNPIVSPHVGLDKGADPKDEKSYAKFNLNDYSPDVMHKGALDFIEKNAKNNFFLYYASPLPHLPLQASKKWLDYYIKKFGDEKPLARASYYPHKNPRAAYAAMISQLDEQVGDLVKKLKELGIYENTMIVFTSDNGPTYLDADVQWFKSASPFKTHSRMNKGYLYEGGIRVPMVVSWPAMIKDAKESDHVSAFWDVFPSFCDLAKVKTPKTVDGISFIPELLNEDQKSHDYLYWEFAQYGGQQAVRMGKWKAVRKNIRKNNLDIELYDLSKDIQESNNVAASHPKIVEKVNEIMTNQHHTSSIDRFKLKSLGDK